MKLQNFKGDLYGTVGDYSGYKDYYVGDIVEITSSYSGTMKCIIGEKDGEYSAYAWMSKSLKLCEIENSMIKLHDYEELSRDLMRQCRHTMTLVQDN